MRDFPEDVIKSYEILRRDLQELEKTGHKNEHLKVILNFIDKIEIDWDGHMRLLTPAGGTLHNLKFEPAAEYQKPHLSPIPEQLRKEHFASERSEREGDALLNPRRVSALQDYLMSSEALGYNIKLNISYESPSRTK